MWVAINLVGALLFASPAFADSCVFSLMPRYALKSDAVNWEMKIASGKTCTKGLNYGAVAVSNVKLTAAPHSGKVTVQGPGFSYTAKPDFEGQDTFTIQVTGRMVRSQRNIRHSSYRIGCKIVRAVAAVDGVSVITIWQISSSEKAIHGMALPDDAEQVAPHLREARKRKLSDGLRTRQAKRGVSPSS